MITRIQKDIDLLITHSWYNTGNNSSSKKHGISGHTFEIIEYFWILKDHLKCQIMFPEDDIRWIDIEEAIRSKYIFTEDDIDLIKNCTIFTSSPNLITGTNVLIVDGEISRLRNTTYLFRNIFILRCSDPNLEEYQKDNMMILQDDRIYNDDLKNTINYKKKILFSKFKKITNSKNKTLLYWTSNCRTPSVNEIKNLKDKDYLICSDKDYSTIAETIKPPIKNIFEKFNKYLYTSTLKNQDCSPRFIAECKYYNKEVEYTEEVLKNITDNPGLNYRKQDIIKNLDSISLEKDDELIKIIKDKINENRKKCN